MIDLISKILEQLVSRYMLFLGKPMIELPDTPIKVSYGARRNAYYSPFS